MGGGGGGDGDQELGLGHVFLPINHLVPSRTLGNAQGISGGHPIFLSWGRGASLFPTASGLIHIFPLQSFRLHVYADGSQMST